MTVPSGYRVVPPPQQLPMVPYERLQQGREVTFTGTRRVKSKGEEYVVHEFVDGDTRKAFALWGCALLDLQLAGVRSGSRMFLQYAGKEQRPNGRTAHSFVVAVSGDVPAPAVNAADDDSDLPF